MWNPFTKPPTPEEMVRKWKAGIRAQERQLDRQVRNIEMEEMKTKKALNELAKKNDTKLSLRKVAGTLQKSTHVMKVVNNLVKIPELHVSVQEMSKEMMKAGIIEEMTMDAMESLDESDIEDEVNEEVEKVLFEVTNGILGKAETIKVPGKTYTEPNAAIIEDADDGVDLDEMRSRLSALKG
ncbi:hypothetical protein BB559_003222 [Furculomyces boomerangus]|uniref:Charged multivesicular body protein 3 n=1 Tax=Furculomyces boomerangus TaxID=61424 RepID=A0A2T9YMX9_9FUNG|nr:hypothetical protein BB559_003222 [Furculomyces boomerangus]